MLGPGEPVNYYQARQRTPDGRWDWTCQNDERIWADGYCGGYPWTPERLAAFRARFPGLPLGRELADAEVLRDRYHEDGHTTREEAERCFHQYQLDHLEARKAADIWKVCAADGCEQLTPHVLAFRHGPEWFLCGVHRTRETVEQLAPFRPGLTVASSY